jgi:hypothetical protein
VVLPDEDSRGADGKLLAADSAVAKASMAEAATVADSVTGGNERQVVR